MRPVGRRTRGTTGSDRLRRSDVWTVATHGAWLAAHGTGTAVDLGFGASGVTTAQWARRLHARAPDLRVVGLEIDRDRVRTATDQGHDGITFAHGGFELAGERPVLVRALNVLRQYDESEVAGAWHLVQERLAPGGRFLEGTCSEDGRVAVWVWLDASGPQTVTFAADLATLDSPATFAERLPKALIHRNVAGEPIHALLRDAAAAWLTARTPFGPVERWRTTVAALRAGGWPVLDRPRGTARGELTVPWECVRPGASVRVQCSEEHL